MNSAAPSSPIVAPSRGHRGWVPIAIVLLAVAGIVILQMQPELERNFLGMIRVAIVLLAVVLTLLWLLLLSRFPWQLRLGVAVALGLVIFAGKKSVRVVGTADGTGRPRLAWRWSAEPQPRLAAPPPTAPAAPLADDPRLAQAADVPQFFGPARDGVVREAGLARDWTATPPRELWRQPIGSGWSAFAVVGGRAFTQEQRGEEELVTCYELLTGRLLWAHADHARFHEWQGGAGPRATPTVGGGRVFALGATGILNCLDAETGRREWSRDVLGENHLANLLWGVSCSPLLVDDSVIVTGGLTSGPTLFAYRRSTGEPLWKTGTDKASYSSPSLATLAGRRVVLAVNATSFTIHDPANGAVLLDFPWSDKEWPKASQPAVLDGDRVFLAAGYGLGCMMLKITAGADGRLTATQLWKNLRMKTQFNSVAPRGGFIYGLDDGLLACVDLATGERKWKDGRYGSGQTLLVDDLILIQSEPGPVVLASARPDAFAELGRLPALRSKTWNHPTLAGRYLLVRNDQEAVCYELPLAASTAAR